MKSICNKLRFRIGILVLLSAIFMQGCEETERRSFTEDDLVLIPKPKNLELREGSFSVNSETKLVLAEDSLQIITPIITDLFDQAAGFQLQTVKETPEENFIQLKFNSKLGNEAYNLDVSNDQVILESGSHLGFVYGLETIRQLLPKEIESQSFVDNTNWLIPNVSISDVPQYSWRGNMLDVSRHFFDKEYIKKHLDRMAFLKLNTFHFHLIDDQGWRIEIKKYPKLTEVGAFRVDQEDKHWNARAENDSNAEATFGGFYTQEEIKEIVAYASDLGIRVVPEIEMPAHVMSAIAAYPWLSCTGEAIAVPSGGVWPITSIYCPGKETTFEFLEDVLTEVIPLFPGEYIHVGGDEATKTNWESCPDCQRRIREEGLSGVEELQGYFMQRMENFLAENDRTLIGWDEILEGGLPEEATVMSWRGFEGGWEASKEGHDVVMTPTSHMYFDYYQGNPDNEPIAFNAFTPLSQVYKFRPVLDSMSTAQKEHILGGQANLWAEYIPTEEQSEYMLFPRLTALSEVVWTPEEKLDWNAYARRVQKMMERFDIMGINYAKSAYAITPSSKINLDSKSIEITMEAEFPDQQIRYALNEELNNNSPVYENPISLDTSAILKAAVFKNGQPMGTKLEKEFVFHKGVASEVDYKNEFSDRYKGSGETTLVDVLRGSKNFHDGRWQGWIRRPAVVTLDLEENKSVQDIKVGTIEHQGAGIYFPQNIIVEVSTDNSDFRKVGEMDIDFENNPESLIKDFSVDFEEQEARYIRVSVEPRSFSGRRGSWLFIDEILVN
ncbi:glycoside hydrolase family 20 protein [Autumnicola musiva]|uniref:beta-N-acetylhexosaminidase n=1 Tax=Autumnicola musiva TaxID=3075589 RepID=A0ABU3D2W7_9FLAO|nr:family 20 glycosylhydrolase [Zunongwangia sp. F117]MDT0675881.1 family 20 glycosylhydrolase [Zunongwangia sp. F117]